MSDINFAEPVKSKKPIYKNPLFWGAIALAIVAVIVVLVITLQPQQSGTPSNAEASNSVEMSTSSANSTFVSENSSDTSTNSADSLVDYNGKQGVDYFTEEELKQVAQSFDLSEKEIADKINEVNASFTKDDVERYIADHKDLDETKARTEMISKALLSNLPMTVDTDLVVDMENIELQPNVGFGVADGLMVMCSLGETDGSYEVTYTNEGDETYDITLAQWKAVGKDGNELNIEAQNDFDETVAPGDEITKTFSVSGEVVFIKFSGSDEINGCTWRVDGK